MQTVNGNTNQKDLTLVLGGTGKTGRRVAEQLKALGVPTRIGSRSARRRLIGMTNTWALRCRT
jgi:phosphoglycerate dehydrogenase-like enzyme